MIAPNAVQGAELRLARYYARKLRQTNERLEPGGAAVTSAINTFDQELAQIRYWQAYVVKQKGHSSDHDRLLVEFALNILVTHQPFDEQMDWVQPALAAAQRLEDRRSESALLKETSYILLRQGDLSAARAAAERALELAQQLNDKYLEARAVLQLGQIMTDGGDFELARQYSQHALDLGELDMKSKIKINTWLGYIAYCEDEFEISGAYIEDNIRLSRALGDLSELATALVNLGMTYLDTGKEHEAIPLIRESISIQRSLGEKNIIGHGLQTLAGYYTRLGSLAAAQPYADEHLAIATEIGSPVEMVWAHGNLAAISREQGDYQRAYAYLLEDKEFIESSDSLGSRIYHDFTLAGVLLPLGEYSQARELCSHLLADASPMLESKDLLDIHNYLGQIARAEGNLDQAIALWGEALALTTNQYAQQIILHSALADAYLCKSDFPQAQTHIDAANQIAHEQDDMPGKHVVVEALTLQARLDVHLGKLEAAKVTLCDAMQRVYTLEVIVPRLNALVAASECLTAIGDVRSVKVLSVVTHHRGIPHAQRMDSLKQYDVLVGLFGARECDHYWAMGKTLVLSDVFAELLAEWCVTDSASG
jgi:tetratricopeptide (TPR) repeat protein